MKKFSPSGASSPGWCASSRPWKPCPTYQPWHNKQTGKTYLVPDDGKCLHYYFYFLDEDLGLCLRACAHLVAVPAASLL